MSNVVRPGPLLWLWYAAGGRLPERHREWVLHDVTTRTWPLRQMGRSLVQLVPVAALLLLVVPGELWVRVVAVLGGALVGMVYAASFVQQTTEQRAMKAGYPPGYAQAVRDRRDTPGKAAAAQRYADRYRGGSGPTSPGTSSG